MKKSLVALLLTIILLICSSSFFTNSVSIPFVDVKTTEYYYDAVSWAYNNNITSGSDDTHFDPDGLNTRAQMVTFLWRSVGEPNPTSLDTSFVDVSTNEYYSKAVSWAVEKGITTGTSDTTFSPNEPVTRGQTVTFLYRFAKADSTDTVSPFEDVTGDYWLKPIIWAFNNNITTGTDETHFEPKSNCTRAQIVTFLWRLIEQEQLLETEYTDGSYTNFSNNLALPNIKKVLGISSLKVDMNNILENGYESKGYAEDLFNSVKDDFLIFYSGYNSTYYYRCGVKTDMLTCVQYAEDGYYLIAEDISNIFGTSFKTEGRVPKTMTTNLEVNGNKLDLIGNTGTLTYSNSRTETIYCFPKVISIGGKASYRHCINVKDVAKLTGLNVYVTDSGVVIFSSGKAFDDVKGYYIASEAVKLFMTSGQEEYTDNEFVDIPNQIVHTSNNVTTYTFPSIDLNANVSAYALQGVKSSVSLGPAIVAGQGESASNQTVVRVFDIYQTLYTQFNAYPASVYGGVQVTTASSNDKYLILTAPYSDTTVKNLKVYDVNGSYVYSISPSTQAPYAIESGKFINDEYCFVATSMYGSSNKKLEFFSAKDGSLITSVQLNISSSKQTVLSLQQNDNTLDELIITFKDTTSKSYIFKYNSPLSSNVGGTTNSTGVYASAFGGLVSTLECTDEYNAFSNVKLLSNNKTVNVGEKENKFFSTFAKDGTNSYVQKGNFWHMRLEFISPVWNSLSLGNTGAIRQDKYSNFNISFQFDEQTLYNTQYNMWEACATHRWNVTEQTKGLINYMNPDTDSNAYAAITRTGETVDYLEMSNSYYNATYAPNIPALERFNYWTRRSYYNKLAVLYRKSPETTVAVSPVHEHEITTDSVTVGDYNSSMISGFADWLENLYGTIEKVNSKYGTNFKSFDELDAPRDQGRGNWDSYTNNPYFTMWVLYNRSIVSANIVQSYREVTLTGFPSELIKAHQIPEGDAVAALLGKANTRVTPVDVALSVGTSYGATRYGVWYTAKTSFFSLASMNGQKNITLGEYSSLTTNKTDAYNQLKYMFNNGLTFVSVMKWSTQSYNDSEQYAIDKLQSENIPRSASSGGTISLRAYDNGSEKYNIVQLGETSTDAGLLKSVNEDGSFEGTVYLQPFHAAVKSVDLKSGIQKSGSGKVSTNVSGRKDATGKALSGINYNDFIDVRLYASPKDGKNGSITIKVYQDNSEIPCLTYTFDVTGYEQEYRYLFKNQTYFENCKIEIEYNNVTISDGNMTLMYEMDARKYYSELSPAQHTGGVSFDIFD